MGIKNFNDLVNQTIGKKDSRPKAISWIPDKRTVPLSGMISVPIK